MQVLTDDSVQMKVIVQSVLHSSDGLSSVVTIKRRCGKKMYVLQT